MSDQDTIFEETTPKSTDQSQQGSQAAGAGAEVTPQWTLPDGADEFIGEGRKYKDPLEALSSIPHKENHISKLEEENKTLREAVDKAKKMEELVEEFRKAQSTTSNGEQTTTVTPQKEVPDLAKLVDEAIEQRSLKQTMAKNGKDVADRLLAEYGDKAQETFQKKANDLGLPIAELHALARRSPTATLTLFGLTASKQPQPKIGSSMNPRVPDESQPKPRPVMQGGTTKDMVASWRHSVEKVNKQLGVN